MSDWIPHREIERSLQELEEKIAHQPGALDLRFERARLLSKLGRRQEAKQLYIDILIQDPNQCAAYINLGVVLTELNFYKAALKVYREAVRRFPHQHRIHLNLAQVLHEVKAPEEARKHYEAALRVIPDDAGAHYGLSDLLMDSGEEKAAVEHRRKGFATQPWTHSIYRGRKEPVRVLLLGSPLGGNAPIQRLIDTSIFLTSAIYVDFYTRGLPIPPHHLVINVIGEAERSSASLDACERILRETTAPVLNPPELIRTTERAENARRLGQLEGVVTPRTVTFSRAILTGSNARSALEEHGFTFPVLLRATGFHGGDNFLRIERSEDLAFATSLPGQELTAIQYLDTRSEDGNFRKYRVMMIDGRLYPLHQAVADQWKVHYFSSLMSQSAAYRGEEAQFLEDMPGVIGPRAMRAMERIRDALGLDYAGADFSLGPKGEVLLFEANATMMAPRPEPGEQWDYRREPVERVYNAVRDMLLRRAKVSA